MYVQRVAEEGSTPSGVGVWGGNPVICRGILGLLAEAGWDAIDVDNIFADQSGTAVLVTVALTPSELRSAAEVIRSCRRPTIAIVGNDDPDLALTALHIGAQSVLPLGTCHRVLAQVAALTVQGLSVTDAAAVALFTSKSAAPDALTEREVDWLSLLRAGATVNQIAAKTDYSERNVYRLLAATYRRLGVSNRGEAIDVATELGYLQPRQS